MQITSLGSRDESGSFVGSWKANGKFALGIRSTFAYRGRAAWKCKIIVFRLRKMVTLRAEWYLTQVGKTVTNRRQGSDILGVVHSCLKHISDAYRVCICIVSHESSWWDSVVLGDIAYYQLVSYLSLSRNAWLSCPFCTVSGQPNSRAIHAFHLINRNDGK